MSSNTYSSGSSLRSDGRKRKDLPPDPSPSAYKRFRRESCLYLTSLATASQYEESGELRSEPDPSSVSCVEDAPGPTPSGSLLSGKPLLSEEEETSCDTKSFLDSGAAGTSVQSCNISVVEFSQATSRELQESAASFDPGLGGPSRRRAADMAGLRSGSRFLAIKRQKCHVSETTVDGGRGHSTPGLGCTRDVTAMTKEEEDGGYLLRSQTEVKVVADSQDDQIAPVPVYVLSSGRISRAQEEALHGGSGGRPPTVDDEFDEYFSQLML